MTNPSDPRSGSPTTPPRRELPSFALVLVTAAAFAAACEHPPAQAKSPDPPAVARVEASGAPDAAVDPARPGCDLVCEGATVVRHKITPDESADFYTNEAVDKANVTLNGMHDDLLACYTTRVKAYPKAHAFLTIDIVVGPDGRVQDVETQGGALLGDGAMHCIVDRIKRGEFATPRQGGTMRLQVPFSLRRVGPEDSI